MFDDFTEEAAEETGSGDCTEELPEAESQKADGGLAKETAIAEKGLASEEKLDDSRGNADSGIKETSESGSSEKTQIKENSEYSDEVSEVISSKEELDVYKNAGLKEKTIDGRICLIRDNIDMDYVDTKSGMTNRELMEKGRSPYDAKTGERIELHHIGQEYDSPLAELTADSEHGNFYSTLHTKESESWRRDEQKSNRYNNIVRPQHWKTRVKEG